MEYLQQLSFLFYLFVVSFVRFSCESVLQLSVSGLVVGRI